MITFQTQNTLTPAQFSDLIQRSELHREFNNLDKLAKMMANADYFFVAYDGQKPVGFTRGLSDDSDVVYIADLAVDQHYRQQNIGRQLIQMVLDHFGDQIHYVLFASLYAKDYYAKLGFTRDERGYIKSPTNLAAGDWTV